MDIQMRRLNADVPLVTRLHQCIQRAAHEQCPLNWIRWNACQEQLLDIQAQIAEVRIR